MSKKARVAEPVEWYFRQGLPLASRYDLPLLAAQEVTLDDLTLIRFSNTKSDEAEARCSTVHFFEDDDRFDQVWMSPEEYVGRLSQYAQVMTPDFSLYMDTPVSLQIVNTLRNRWCGAFWQSRGMTVIPTVSWSDGRSFDFCFSGVEVGAVVAVSTVGSRDRSHGFMRGFSEMCRAIEPQAVICLGEPFEKMRDLVELVVVPYVRTARVMSRV